MAWSLLISGFTKRHLLLNQLVTRHSLCPFCPHQTCGSKLVRSIYAQIASHLPLAVTEVGFQEWLALWQTFKQDPQRPHSSDCSLGRTYSIFFSFLKPLFNRCCCSRALNTAEYLQLIKHARSIFCIFQPRQRPIRAVPTWVLQE